MIDLRRMALAATLCLGWAVGVMADDIKTGDLVIRQVWSRATIASGANGAVYLEIDNSGAAADRLVDVASPVAGMAHLHTTEMQGEMASMKAMDGLDIPAGGKVILKPQADHIMLMDLSQQLKQGGDFPLTLHFEKAGTVEVKAHIEAAGALGPSGE
jgi:hypothetical protein